jgi:hypothetical protein
MMFAQGVSVAEVQQLFAWRRAEASVTLNGYLRQLTALALEFTEDPECWIRSSR